MKNNLVLSFVFLFLLVPLTLQANPAVENVPPGSGQFELLPGTPGGPSCLGLRDFDYEPVTGFDGSGRYFQGHVKTSGEEIEKQYEGRAEGCMYDENGNEKRFVGEWLSVCQIESYDAKGRYFVLETDDCWCKRCLN